MRKYRDANDNITAMQGRGFSDSSFDVTRAERASRSFLPAYASRYTNVIT